LQDSITGILKMNKKIVYQINDKKPDIIVVAMGCPKQEMFMIRNKDKLKFRVAMGVGGSLDVISDTVASSSGIYAEGGPRMVV